MAHAAQGEPHDPALARRFGWERGFPSRAHWFNLMSCSNPENSESSRNQGFGQRPGVN